MQPKPKPIELQFPYEQAGIFARDIYWLLICCWCGADRFAQVNDSGVVDEHRFRCLNCGKLNFVQRRGNRVIISPVTISPVVCVLSLLLIAVMCWFWIMFFFF